MSERDKDVSAGSVKDVHRALGMWSIRRALAVAFSGAAVLLVAACYLVSWLLGSPPKAKARPLDTSAQLDLLKLVFALVAGIGALVALVTAYRRQRIDEVAGERAERIQAHAQRVARDNAHDATERRVTDLYGKAVEQLGHDKAAVRLGGLYALERLAQDHTQHRQTVVGVVCAYLRMPFHPDVNEDDSHQELQVRLTAQRLLAQHLEPRPSEAESATGAYPDSYWEGMDLDLAGAHLINFDLARCRPHRVDFSAARFSGDARFSEARFDGEARFSEARFNGDARFDEARFGGDARFDEAWFDGDAVFDGARFSGNADFGEARFCKDAMFGGVRFSAGAMFGEAQFGRDAVFGGVLFGGDAVYGEARFGGDAVFDGTGFRGNARFEKAQFNGIAEFGGARFSCEAGFGGARFGGKTWFGRARFTETAEFDGARFGGIAMFRGARFGGTAGFGGARFSGDARFSEARFSGNAWFGEVHFCDDASFSEARFGGEAWFDQAQFNGDAGFGEARFGGDARFEDASFDETPRFAGAAACLPSDRHRWPPGCETGAPSPGQDMAPLIQCE